MYTWHKCLFGAVVEEEMSLSLIGSTAKECWQEIPKHFHNVKLDAFVVMPNHIHGIIVITDQGRDVACNVSTGKMISTKRDSLGIIIRSYKSAVSYLCHSNGDNEFRWQSRFYEYIIRHEKDLQNIRDYI
jgi:putative transposase